MNYLKLISIVFILLTLSDLKAQDSTKIVLTLDDALNIAMENSPDIQKSKLYMEINKENLNAQLASLKSQFSFRLTPFEYSIQERYNDYYSEWNTEENKVSRGSLIISQPIKYTDGTLVLRNDLSYQCP